MGINLTHVFFSHIKLKHVNKLHTVWPMGSPSLAMTLNATEFNARYSKQALKFCQLQIHSSIFRTNFATTFIAWNMEYNSAKYTNLLSGTCVWLAAERSPASRGLYWDVKALADAWESKTHFQCLPYDRLICMRNTVCVCNINLPMHATQTVHRRVS